MKLSATTKGLITKVFRREVERGWQRGMLLSLESFAKLRTALERDLPREQAKHLAKRIERIGWELPL